MRITLFYLIILCFIQLKNLIDDSFIFKIMIFLLFFHTHLSFDVFIYHYFS